MSDLPKILIVDDDEDLAEILADYLEDDYLCSVCSDPQKAMELLETKQYDLVISDIHMPNISGFAIIELSAKLHPETPVILLTGNSRSDPIVTQAMEKGAKGVITKPFSSPDKVLQYLKKFVV